MRDFSEETPNVSKISDTKSVIIQELHQMRKWRDIQLQNFRNKQLVEHQSLLQQSEKTLGNFFQSNRESLKKNGKISSRISDRSLSGSEVTLQDQDSTLTGNLLRCFSDSSCDSSTVYKSKDAGVISSETSISNDGSRSVGDNLTQKSHLTEDNLGNSELKKPLKPFLRKRSGLTRFMPKSKAELSKASESTVTQVTYPVVQIKVTALPKLKPALHDNASPPRKINHVQFREPIQYERATPKHLFQQSEGNLISVKDKQESLERYVDDNSSSIEGQDSEVKASSCDESLNSEKDLIEFEMLENFAQNSSFNSDSSVVQRVLHGGSSQKLLQNPLSSLSSGSEIFNYERSQETTSVEFPVSSAKIKLDQCLEELHTRKQHLQNFMSDIDPKIASLQKEISDSNKNSYKDSDSKVSKRCSTPLDETGPLSPLTTDCDSSKNSSSNSIIFVPPKKVDNSGERLNIETGGTDIANEDIINKGCFDEKDYEADSPKQEHGQYSNPVEKSKLREKREELEKEIINYEKECAHLASISKERDEVLKKLKKEHDEFQKKKEEEMKKFDMEMENERRQLKREKENLNRMQKLLKGNPTTRKEREELSALRQEVEKLQRELKKQKVKSDNENRRLKNQLIAAEKERDYLKLENITLEDQVQDFLAVLKTRIAKKTKSGAKEKETTKIDIINSSTNSVNGYADVHVQQLCNSVHSSENFKEKYSSSGDGDKGDLNNTKPKVRFNLIPQFDMTVGESIESDLLTGFDIDMQPINEHHIDLNEDTSENSGTETAIETQIEKPTCEEIQYDDKVERIYFSGEREIIFSNKTRAHISADGETVKLFFPNGDEKEFFPDKRTVYRYVNGDIEERFPSGLIVTVLFNGQIHKEHPSGLKEIQFPDRSMQITHPDGTEETIANDGTIERVNPDGTATVELPNGQKVIRKNGYKRREYPDGSSRTVYSSGRQETRYADGRIIIKDQDGNVVVDTNRLKGLAGKS